MLLLLLSRTEDIAKIHIFEEGLVSLPTQAVLFLRSMRHLCLSCNGLGFAVIARCLAQPGGTMMPTGCKTMSALFIVFILAATELSVADAAGHNTVPTTVPSLPGGLRGGLPGGLPGPTASFTPVFVSSMAEMCKVGFVCPTLVVRPPVTELMQHTNPRTCVDSASF